MNYEDELERFEEDAEDQFDDYNGHYDEYEDEFDTGFGGYEDEDEYYDDDGDDDFIEEEEVEYIPAFEDNGDGEYDSYSRTSIGRIDSNDRTLTVIVTNGSGADAEAVVFGGNESAEQPNGVTVNVSESSHKEVREESKSNPFQISGLKMSVSDHLQFDNVLKITRKTVTGSTTTRPYQPRNATSPQNQTQLLVDDGTFTMQVSGSDSLRFTVKNGVTVVFTFTIRARANMSNLLNGKNVAEVSKSPRTTGLPQIDLLQRKKSRSKTKKRVRKIVRRKPKTLTTRKRKRPMRRKDRRRRR